jgi:hypothetical protein
MIRILFGELDGVRLPGKRESARQINGPKA